MDLQQHNSPEDHKIAATLTTHIYPTSNQPCPLTTQPPSSELIRHPAVGNKLNCQKFTSSPNILHLHLMAFIILNSITEDPSSTTLKDPIDK
ncbi:hypothetical protein CDL15_Pgr017799 [Punica granatum]|uniref:Uncharacterized protein n=1 Tax=Punica granatum TaxID=22663 RepID=A0A218WGV7_PUNGR|nr:hypothetical protein CDL15_Pgr017799 [Punica granatum]